MLQFLWQRVLQLDMLFTERGAESVRRAARAVLETVQARGHRRFVLSSGCTLAPETPAENLDALFETARAFGAWSLTA